LIELLSSRRNHCDFGGNGFAAARPRQGDLDVWWWYNTGDKISIHSVIGYGTMNKRTDGNRESGLQPTGKEFHDKMTGTNVAAVELVFDATISEGNDFINVSSTSGIIPVQGEGQPTAQMCSVFFAPEQVRYVECFAHYFVLRF
jgi:hypothetical protein